MTQKCFFLSPHCHFLLKIPSVSFSQRYRNSPILGPFLSLDSSLVLVLSERQTITSTHCRFSAGTLTKRRMNKRKSTLLMCPAHIVGRNLNQKSFKRVAQNSSFQSIFNQEQEMCRVLYTGQRKAGLGFQGCRLWKGKYSGGNEWSEICLLIPLVPFLG